MSLSSSITPSRPRRLAVLTALLTGVGGSALALAPAASAATFSTTYTYTGSQESFVVPDGVTSVHVVAVGGQGGSAAAFGTTGTQAGGFGAAVSADLDVTGGEQLYVTVGSNGQDGQAGTAAAPGFNGGGVGIPHDGGGGGGASDVRTVPPGTGSLASRLLVAGGGGGAANGGAGGASAQNGSPGGSTPACGAGPGGGGGQTSGGAGGTSTLGSLPNGADGSLGSGGNGGQIQSGADAGGGGGGGGLYGGGGGSAGIDCAGGGGGGSSYVDPADGHNSMFGSDPTGTPRVTISYVVPQQPQATTTGASDVGVGTGQATLNGVVNPEGVATSYHFDMAMDLPSAPWSTVTGEIPIGSGTAQIHVTSVQSNLSPGVSWRFRVVATNAFGVTDGGTQTFTTPARRPDVTTDPASDIGTTSATLNGVVSPNGPPTSYHFEYGTDTSYGSRAGDGSTSGFGHQPAEATLTNLEPGTTYYFRLVASSFLGPNFDQGRSFTTLGAKPQANTTPANGIGQGGATLHGVVNPEGVQTTYSFEYGTDTTYGSTVPGGMLAASFTQSAVQAPLTGLTAGTTYHYRVVATNSLGTTNGDDESFSTQATPPPPALAPTATTSPASRIGQHGATLNGAVNPRGAATTYYFQYGRTTSYGSRTATLSAGSGTTAANVSAILAGLPRHTTYHFRLVAVSPNGTVRGVDRTFRTT